ncbi:MAG: FG-GAP repeat protein [Nanoarchaeota archaeon]|nr:FG-GAP repeat protein [Nanoarchaeota archaeon]
MKKVQTVFLIIVVVVLAVVGYFYYSLNYVQASPGIGGSKILFPRWFTKEVTPTPTLLECVDSDGEDIYTKGNVGADFPSDAGYITYWDECISLDEVKEWVCEDNQAVALSIDCDFGCFDGACAPPPWIQEQKLVASDAYGGDTLGSSAAMDGDVAILGATGDDDLGDESGSAYIYRFDGVDWSEGQKLLASDGAAGDKFGYSVSISGNVAVVGAYYDDDLGSNSGSAYVYRFNSTNWVEEQKLNAFDGEWNDQFGKSVSISDDVILIGASLASDTSNPRCGAAYVFRFNGSSWIQEKKLLASDGTLFDSFGSAVFVSGNVAFIGAVADDDNELNSGSTYLFSFNGADWIEEQKLTASDGAQSEQFGWSVAVSDGVAVIGANRDNDLGLDSGSAYVFRFDGVNWVEESKLLASDGAAGDDFGSIVSISGNTTVIGAHLNGELGWKAGATYVYRFDGLTWVEEQKLASEDIYPLDEFGSAVAIHDNKILVGTVGEDHYYMGTGAAYVFRASGE